MDKNEEQIFKIAVRNGILKPDGRPIFIIDHQKLIENYKKFTESLPRVQAYFAVKANSDPEIVKTLFKQGSSFDVAS